MTYANSDRSVNIIDTTLRDGAQSADIALSLSSKLRIVSLLSEIGIRIFEAGIPAMGQDEQSDIKGLIRLFPDCTFIPWCRAKQADIEAARMCGCSSVHISFPISPAHMKIYKFSEQEIIDRLAFYCQLSSRYFRSISIGAQDASRASPEFLDMFVKTASECGASQVRIADTVGILSPATTHSMINRLMLINPACLIDFHGHNDFGMATANTLTALEAGASYASVTVNGTGERAGNAPLEEVVMAVKYMTQLKIEISLNSLTFVCSEIAKIMHQTIHPSKPISGSNLFRHEAGIHCHGLLSDKSAYEPYNPAVTGHSSSEFVSGTHSGRAGVLSMLNSKGIDPTQEQLTDFMQKIRSSALKKGKSLDIDDTCKLFCNNFV